MAVIAMTQEMATLGKDVALAVCEALGLQQVRHEVGDVVAGRMQVKKSLIRRIREGKASTIERWSARREDISAGELIDGGLGRCCSFLSGCGLRVRLLYPTLCLSLNVLNGALEDLGDRAFREHVHLTQCVIHQCRTCRSRIAKEVIRLLCDVTPLFQAGDLLQIETPQIVRWIEGRIAVGNGQLHRQLWDGLGPFQPEQSPELLF